MKKLINKDGLTTTLLSSLAGGAVLFPDIFSAEQLRNIIEGAVDRAASGDLISIIAVIVLIVIARRMRAPGDAEKMKQEISDAQSSDRALATDYMHQAQQSAEEVEWLRDELAKYTNNTLKKKP